MLMFSGAQEGSAGQDLRDARLDCKRGAGAARCRRHLEAK